MQRTPPPTLEVLKASIRREIYSNSESVINMFQNAQWQKPIFQELISRVLLEIETRGPVFCIALGPVTISIAIKTIGLLYLFYNTG